MVTAVRRASPPPPRAPGLFAGMRVRKKLLLLHTVFSLVLAGILLLALRPPVAQIVASAEADKADAALRAILANEDPQLGVELRVGLADELGLSAADATRAAADLFEPVSIPSPRGTARALAVPPTGDGEPTYFIATAVLPEARAAASRVFLLLIGSLLAIYALIVVALEIFVLPRYVYAPIRMMLRADEAVQRRDHEAELIPAHLIPADELGEIMQSRNASVRALRRQEAALADALDRLERVAGDLKRKNHLLENARRSLEGADRLASLGMMSAGIAHELNTPLAVAKGLVERLRDHPSRSLSESDAALLQRVVKRLERLGESLLDFARVRPPELASTRIHSVVDEAITLVRLDRGPKAVEIVSLVPHDLTLDCDPDRMVQVFVNLIRNAVDAVVTAAPGLDPPPGRVTVSASCDERDGGDWVSLRVADDGPGIDPAVLPNLFEPFVSSRLDSKGTGLGLAVAEGIVREHTGALIARNRTGARGAEFEVLLPATRPSASLMPDNSPESGDSTSQRASQGP